MAENPYSDRSNLCTLCQGLACEVCCGTDGPHGCVAMEVHRYCPRCTGSGLEPRSASEEVRTDG